MNVILQIDCNQALTIIGLIIAFITGSATNLISDSIKRRRLRRAVYKEIDVMYFALKYALRHLEEELARVKTDEEYTLPVKEIYSALQYNLSSDVYKYLKTQPALSLGMKDINDINNLYLRFSAFNVACETDGVNPALFKTQSLPQGRALKGVCEAIIDLIERALKHDINLDQKLLLKLANPAQREGLRKLFQTCPAGEIAPSTEEQKGPKNDH